jgi:hypothetical protein
MEERWWYIDGAPGYMISDCGRVWSEKSQWFVKPKPMDRIGHMGVCLYVNGQLRYFYIHRLMAEAFIPNPHDYPVVRHLNDVPDYNEIRNLAWGTQYDNYLDCVRNGHYKPFTDEAREKSNEVTRTPIIAIDIETGETFRFRGQGEAARMLGIQQANIWKVLNGERRQAGGYHFEYDKGGGYR